MANLRLVDIPKRAREGMRGFATLGDTEAEAIVGSLGEFEGILRPPAIEERISAAAPSLADPAGFTLGLLTLISQTAEIPIAEVAAAVGRSRDLGDLEETQREKFPGRLERLLRAPCIRLSGKAWDLTTEYEHVFLAARILTDVRPVFKGDVDEEGTTPAAAVIMDTLKLDFYGPNGDVRSLYIALDREDLDSLESAVKRGIRKTDSMSKFLADASLPSWNANG
jgi:hypothetical protein